MIDSWYKLYKLDLTAFGFKRQKYEVPLGPLNPASTVLLGSKKKRNVLQDGIMAFKKCFNF